MKSKQQPGSSGSWLRQLGRRKTVQQILREAELDPTEAPMGGLRRSLGVWDLTALGIAAIVGAGIFSTIGQASMHGGPAVSVLFVFTAAACALAALCYSEFAARIPIAGSAYTYAYSAFGELVAWIIGWDLLMEYCIGNVVVAISWSDYFTGLLAGWGLALPHYLGMDFLTAWRGFQEVEAKLADGASLAALPDNLQAAWQAWTQAPRLAGLPLIADLPALGIVAIITALVYVGIKESKRANNLLVGLKLGVIALVVLVGVTYVNPENWSPFAPNGFSGVMHGVSAVFFAFIGFDAITTTAEESHYPQRDLPRAIFYSLIGCTVLYVIIALTLTGMVPYHKLGVGDPMAFVFTQVGLQPAMEDLVVGVIAISAVIAMTGVLLVFQMGQPRIWMSMSRDGLLPPAFARIHPRFRTPSFATVVTGLVVAIPALFMNLSEVTELTSIGTLFAFVLVCGGVLRMQLLEPEEKVHFPLVRYALPEWRLPLGGKWTFPINLYVVGTLALGLWLAQQPEKIQHFLGPDQQQAQGWALAAALLPLVLFAGLCLMLAVLSARYRLPTVPALGLLTCFYLMSEVPTASWLRFLAWLALGLLIYFLYSKQHSRLETPPATGDSPSGDAA